MSLKTIKSKMSFRAKCIEFESSTTLTFDEMRGRTWVNKKDETGHVRIRVSHSITPCMFNTTTTATRWYENGKIITLPIIIIILIVYTKLTSFFTMTRSIDSSTPILTKRRRMWECNKLWSRRPFGLAFERDNIKSLHFENLISRRKMHCYIHMNPLLWTKVIITTKLGLNYWAKPQLWPITLNKEMVVR